MVSLTQDAVPGEYLDGRNYEMKDAEEDEVTSCSGQETAVPGSDMHTDCKAASSCIVFLEPGGFLTGRLPVFILLTEQREAQFCVRLPVGSEHLGSASTSLHWPTCSAPTLTQCTLTWTDFKVPVSLSSLNTRVGWIENAFCYDQTAEVESLL